MVIAAGHDVFGFLSDPYWLDLGTPAQYLEAHFDLFEGKVRGVSYPAPVDRPDGRRRRARASGALGGGRAGSRHRSRRAGRRLGDPPGRRRGGGGADRRVGPGPGVPSGIRGHPDGMRSGGRVPGGRRRRPGRGTGAGRHGCGRGVASPVRPDPCVTVRLPTGSPSMRRIRSLVLVVAVSAALVPAPAARADGPITFYGSGWGHGLGLSQWGAYGLAAEGVVGDQDPHALLQRHEGDEERGSSRRHPDRARVGRGRVASHRGGRTGASVREEGGRGHARRQDPRRRDVGRSIRRRRVPGARRDRRRGRREDLGQCDIRSLRDVRRPRRARHGARRRCDLQPRHARVQPHDLHERLLAPADPAGPVRGVPARDRRGAEQLARGGAACAGDRRAELRALQAPEVRPAADVQLRPDGRLDRPGVHRVGQGRAAWTARVGSRRSARRPARS